MVTLPRVITIDETKNDYDYVTNEIINNRWFSLDNLQENLKAFSPIKNIKIEIDESRSKF